MIAAWSPNVLGVFKNLQGLGIFAGPQDGGDAVAHDLTRWPPGVLVRLRVEVDGKRLKPLDAIHGSIVTSTLAIDHGETNAVLFQSSSFVMSQLLVFVDEQLQVEHPQLGFVMPVETRWCSPVAKLISATVQTLPS